MPRTALNARPAPHRRALLCLSIGLALLAGAVQAEPHKKHEAKKTPVVAKPAHKKHAASSDLLRQKSDAQSHLADVIADG